MKLITHEIVFSTQLPAYLTTHKDGGELEATGREVVENEGDQSLNFIFTFYVATLSRHVD